MTNGSAAKMLGVVLAIASVIGVAGSAAQETPPDIQCDGNLHWCVDSDIPVPTGYLDRVRNNPISLENKKAYPPGWASESLVSDPLFVRFERRSDFVCDFRLQDGSPANGHGIVLPTELEDPHRPQDGARPAIGALPHGAAMFAAGR